jgi:para-nitrobenzyl esterase
MGRWEGQEGGDRQVTGRWTPTAPVVALLAAVSLVAASGAPVDAGPAPRTVVATTAGEVRGVEHDGVHRFRGVPYAAPPVGERRWEPPQQVGVWTGIRDASRPGPACVQPTAPDMPPGTPQSEDCLTLEVTAPAGPGGDRPVLVWIPGGGFVTGAGSIYDPTRLVKAGGIVVVTVNYRLGVFGFFAHPELGRSSNFGLQDQVAALRWVRDNIAGFGGDPGSVTLAGASAGAMSACTLMTSPAARGLFHRAIVQSGSCHTAHAAGSMGEGVAAVSSWHPLSTIQGTGLALAERLSCTDLACLRDTSADDLLPHTGWFPLVAYGTDLVPREPAAAFAAGEQAAVPLLQGNTHDEHIEFTLAAYPEGVTGRRYSAVLRTAFGRNAPRVERRYPLREFPSPTAAVGRVFGDSGWICPSWRSGGYHADHAPTYAYVFSDPSAPTPSGHPLPAHVRPATAHGAETFYLFDFPDGPELTADQRVLADRLVGYWARFTRTGDPNGDDAPAWPRLDSAGSAGSADSADSADSALRIGEDAIRPVDMDAEHHCGLWDTA